MNYSEIKKLDEESLQKLSEGPGPADSCICNLLAPPEGSRKGFRSSIKKAFANLNAGRKSRAVVGGQRSIDIPLSFVQSGKGGLQPAREGVKRKTPCGKCGCDQENIVLKHSYANIRITSPDVSSICPCPQDCLPDKDKLMNNIKVTIERAQLLMDADAVDSEFNIYEKYPIRNIIEPNLALERERRSLSSLVDEQYHDDVSEWSSGNEL